MRLGRRAAIILVAVYFGGMAVVAVLADYARLFRAVPLNASPDDVAYLAEGILAKVDLDDGRPDVDLRLYANVAYLHYLKDDPNRPPITRLRAGQPAGTLWLYRQSPRALAPVRSNVLPPVDVPCMVTMCFGPNGDLVSFHAMPSDEPPAPERPRISWGILFSSAGLNSTQFRRVTPLGLPASRADERLAWEGAFPNQHVPLRVEAASFLGHPTLFRVMGPWDSTDELLSEAAGDRHWSPTFPWRPSAVLVLLGGAVVTGYHWRRKEADLVGCILLFTCMAGMSLAWWWVKGNGQNGANSWTEALIDSLCYGGMVGLGYSALEPFVRRAWPETLLGWQKIAAGRVLDVVVGRDVLIGGACGAAGGAAGQLVFLAGVWLDRPDLTSPVFWRVDLNHAISPVLGAEVQSVGMGLAGFFAATLLKSLLRRDWLVVLVAALLALLVPHAMPSNDGFAWNADLVWGAIPQTIQLGLAAIVALRFGLLPLIIGVFVTRVLETAPVTYDLTTWYWWYTVLALACLGVLGIFGFLVSQRWERELHPGWTVEE